MFAILKYGLSVAVVGMLTVFVALIILIALIKGMEKGIAAITGKKKIDNSVNGAKPEVTPMVVQTTEVGGDELVAVITAAIAAVMEAEGVEAAPNGFVVRSIRRISNAPAWNRAGREEQVYSRM